MALNHAQSMQGVNPVFTSLGQQQPGFFSGRNAQLASINRFNPQAQNALSSLLTGAQQGMANPYAGFEPIEQKARSQFQQQTIPSIAERFAGLGSNALSSGAFATQLGQAGAGLEESLAALKSQYGLQNRGQLLKELMAGITPQMENFYQPREESGLEALLGPLFSALGLGTGAALGGGGLQAILKLISGGQ